MEFYAKIHATLHIISVSNVMTGDAMGFIVIRSKVSRINTPLRLTASFWNFFVLGLNSGAADTILFYYPIVRAANLLWKLIG